MNSCSSGRRPRIMASSFSLRQDTIVLDILSRLPVKSLTRFKSVSKNWALLTSNPAFVAAHLRRSSPDTSLLVRRYNTQSGSETAFLLYADPIRSSRFRSLDIPDEAIVSFPKIVGSVDGLVCLDVSPCYASDFILWNPGTKQFKYLPFPSITSSKTNPIWLVFIGFGFDPHINDYKLVRVVSFKTNDASPRSRVEVFSWKGGFWKEILDESFHLTGLSGSQEGVVTGGSLNWFANGLEELEDQKFVISFNLETEVFKRIQLPPIARYGNAKVMSYRGLLAIAVYPILYAPNAYNMNQFEFWVLDGGGDGLKDWTNMVVIPNFAKCLVPMRTWRDRELVIKLMDVKDRESYQCLWVYDPVDEVSQRLKVDGVLVCLEGWGYVESLVSVDGRS